MMVRAVLADTGPLYAAADRTDAYHRRAQRELKRLAQEKIEIIVPYSMLLEAYTLVLYRLGNAAASRWLAEIQEGVSLMNPAPQDYQDALRKLAALADQPVTLFDAVLAVLSERLETAVWTYDHHFDLMRARIWR